MATKVKTSRWSTRVLNKDRITKVEEGQERIEFADIEDLFSYRHVTRMNECSLP